MRLSSLLIILIVSALILSSGFLALRSCLDEDANAYYIADLLHTCKPIKIRFSGRTVILRLDDVQALAWRDISIQMIDEALRRNMPVVLGVIPMRLERDEKMVDYLKRNECNIEIAQHGWSHNIDSNLDIAEFSDLSKEEAYAKIIKGKRVLESITNRPITTFIPPNNRYSSGTVAALDETGFKVVSSEGSEYFDYTASTYNFEKQELVSVANVINDCNKSLDQKETCMIMLHPQDYTDNGVLDLEKYKNYLQLLDALEAMNVSFVKIQDFVDKDSIRFMPNNILASFLASLTKMDSSVNW